MSTLFYISAFSQQNTVKPFINWTSTNGGQFMYKRNVIKQYGAYTYVAGATINHFGYYDMLLEKISDSGTLVWSRTFSIDSTAGNSAASGIAFDSVGNIYVCGTAYRNSVSQNDMLLIKYRPNGSRQWVRTFNYTGSGNDGATDIAIDSSSSEVIITGTGYNYHNDLDFITLCYDMSNGHPAWKAFYDHGGNEIAARIIQNAGAVYVTGVVQGANYMWKTAVISYNMTNGHQKSIAYTAAGNYASDIVGGFFRDDSGNIYVTGAKYVSGQGYNVYIVKYDTLLTNQWSVNFDGGHYLNDYGNDVVVNGNGDVYVCATIATTNQGQDIDILKYNSNGVLKWKNEWNNASQNKNDSASAITFDNSGKYIYVTGKTWNGSNYDYLMLKYDTAGNKIWQITRNGLADGNDIPTGVASNPINNDMVVTGTSMADDSSLTYLTVDVKQLTVPSVKDSIAEPGSWSYTENRGQLLNTDSNLATNVKYYSEQGSPAVYFMDDTVSYVWARIDTAASTQDTLQRVDMFFPDHLPDMRVWAFSRQSFYTNYFLGYLPKMRTDVPHYGMLLYKNVWNGIDMECGANNEGFKYYFIVKAGTKVNSIKLAYKGQNNLYIHQDGLVISTELGYYVQARPYAYTVDANGNRTALSWSPTCSISGHILTISWSGSYNHNQNLIIAIGQKAEEVPGEKGLCWSSYFGGDNGQTYVNGIDIDDQDNKYIAGSTTNNTTTFPVTIGIAYQYNLNGAEDAFTAKFDYQDSLRWCTYFGGSTNEAFDVKYNHNNHSVYIAGYTSLNLPTQFKAGAYNDGTLGNGAGSSTDGFIAQFDTTGSHLIWSTYFGGYGAYSNFDRIKNMAFDPSGNLFVLGETNSATGFPQKATGNQYTQTYGGADDAFIAKFNSADSLVWSTYYGGTDKEEAYSLTVDHSGNIAIFGITFSSDLPTFKTGNMYCDSILNNGNGIGTTPDDFIVKFNGAGQRLWATYFGGSNFEIGAGLVTENNIAFDGNNDLYVVGMTKSSGDFPVQQSTGFYDSTGSNWNMWYSGFISRFNANNQLVWSSFIGGGTGNVAPRAVSVAANGMVYVAGSLTDDSLPLHHQSSLYYRNTLSGTSTHSAADAFLMAFDTYNNLNWGTYFGGYQNSSDESVEDLVIHNSTLYAVGYTSSLNATVNTTLPFPLYQPTPAAYLYSGFDNATASSGFISSFCVDNILGIKDYDRPDAANIILYPNPAKNYIIVELPASIKNGSYKIMDETGRLIKKSEFSAARKLRISTKDLSKGLYFIQIIPANKAIHSSSALRFIKQ